MTKRKTTVIAGAVWLVALASTGAFAYTMNRPLTLPPAPAVAAIESADKASEALVPEPAAAPEPRVIVLPTVEIVSYLPRRPAARPPAPKPRDISEMKCSGFRPLEQGTGGVQVCE